MNPNYLFNLHKRNKAIENETKAIEYYKPVSKDILIVVRNQLEYIKSCVESIFENTEDFNLFIWNNGSAEQTSNYLRSIPNITLLESDGNEGFIRPNNELVKLGHSPFVILLNSDTKVYKNWDKALISLLQNYSQLGQVGYMGGILDSECRGTKTDWGENVDFISGWCSCFRRETYDKFGLFDGDNLNFAYGEDSDFSLRLREAGYKIYALYSELVFHEGNITIKEVIKEEGEQKLAENFNVNHMYLKRRWGKFLEKIKG